MKRLVLLFFFIFIGIHAYSSFKTKANPTSFKNQNFTNSDFSDSLALVALYNKCNGLNWTKKDNWLTGRLDTWQGVFVENGRVVGLFLGDLQNSFGLSGELPSELSNLSELRALNLSNNKLTGTLPDKWKTLVNLEEIWLLNNQLTGSLPDSWSALSKLHGIQFGGNQLTGTLPESWSALQNLNYLDF